MRLVLSQVLACVRPWMPHSWQYLTLNVTGHNEENSLGLGRGKYKHIRCRSATVLLLWQIEYT